MLLIGLSINLHNSNTQSEAPQPQAEELFGGYVHSVEPSAAVDGPGMRFALFVSGCQMRCLYCHNPDTWDRKAGTWRTVDDVIAEIARYKPFLKHGGGVTISGGEPLVQPVFVHEIFRRCKEELQLHTALDTNGLLAKNFTDDWFDVVDMVLLDIKQIDPERHKALTGTSNDRVLEFAKRLDAMKKPTWIRYVLVPGYTDGEEDVDKLAQFVATLSNVERLEILPFHKMGEYKWQDLGLQYELTDVRPPSDDIIERVKKQFESYNIYTVV